MAGWLLEGPVLISHAHACLVLHAQVSVTGETDLEADRVSIDVYLHCGTSSILLCLGGEQNEVIRSVCVNTLFISVGRMSDICGVHMYVLNVPVGITF